MFLAETKDLSQGKDDLSCVLLLILISLLSRRRRRRRRRRSHHHHHITNGRLEQSLFIMP